MSTSIEISSWLRDSLRSIGASSDRDDEGGEGKGDEVELHVDGWLGGWIEWIEWVRIGRKDCGLEQRVEVASDGWVDLDPRMRSGTAVFIESWGTVFGPELMLTITVRDLDLARPRPYTLSCKDSLSRS